MEQVWEGSMRTKNLLSLFLISVIAFPSMLWGTHLGWTEHEITSPPDGARSVYSADVDGDGDMDIVAASDHDPYNNEDGRVAWYENDGGGNFTEHVITTGSNPLFVHAKDMDGDGDMDVISGSQGMIVWHENDGDESFTTHLIGTVGAAQSVYVVDINSDGDMDVVVASYWDGVVWYDNDGSESFSHNTITASSNGVVSVYAADVDGDGDVDLLSAYKNDYKIAWYENIDNAGFLEIEHIISTDAQLASYVYAEDVDGDGDMDVLSASEQDQKIAWYENDGTENFTEHALPSAGTSPHSVYAEDIDSDGDMDLLATYTNMGGSYLTFYENDDNANFTLSYISTDVVGVYTVHAADLDGDGDLDVVSAGVQESGCCGDHTVGRIAWHENTGSHASEDPIFLSYEISTSADGARDVYAADMDGDGDLDVLSASIDDDNIAWYENDGIENFTEHAISIHIHSINRFGTIL